MHKRITTNQRREPYRQLTPELSHAGPMTQVEPRLPGKPTVLPGVGSSDLVSPSFVCIHRREFKNDASNRSLHTACRKHPRLTQSYLSSGAPRESSASTQLLAGRPPCRCCQTPSDARSPASRRVGNDTSQTNK